MVEKKILIKVLKIKSRVIKNQLMHSKYCKTNFTRFLKPYVKLSGPLRQGALKTRGKTDA